MSQIDTTYFERRIIVVPNVDKPHIAEKLQDYIDIYEDEYLKKMLGIELADLYLAGIASETPDQRYIDLRNGKTYEYGGKTYEWKGFLNDTTKISPIANYVYCNMIADDQSSNTGLGEVKPNAENSTVIPPYYRMGRAWSDMAVMNRSLVHFLITYKSIYPEWEELLYCSPLLKEQNVIGI